MRILALLLGAMLYGLMVPAPARAWTPIPCTPARTQSVATEAVQAAIRQWEGRCVRLRGIATSRRLYTNRPALADAIEIYGALPPRSIVIYPDERGVSFDGPPRQVEIVGRIGNCQTAHEVVAEQMRAEPDSFVMVAGYCHTSTESYVRPESIRTLSSASVPRLSEAEVPVERRPLAEAPPDLPGRAAHAAAVHALLVAVEAGDVEAFNRLNEPGERAGTNARRENARAWREARRALAGLGAGSGRQARTFVDRHELSSAGRRGEPYSFYVLTCFCRDADCTGRWPIRREDADNLPARPYACITTNDYVLYQRPAAIQATAEVGHNGFAEPDWRQLDGHAGERQGPGD